MCGPRRAALVGGEGRRKHACRVNRPLTVSKAAPRRGAAPRQASWRTNPPLAVSKAPSPNPAPRPPPLGPAGLVLLLVPSSLAAVSASVACGATGVFDFHPASTVNKPDAWNADKQTSAGNADTTTLLPIALYGVPNPSEINFQPHHWMISASNCEEPATASRRRTRRSLLVGAAAVLTAPPRSPQHTATASCGPPMLRPPPPPPRASPPPFPPPPPPPARPSGGPNHPDPSTIPGGLLGGLRRGRDRNHGHWWQRSRHSLCQRLCAAAVQCECQAGARTPTALPLAPSPVAGTPAGSLASGAQPSGWRARWQPCLWRPAQWPARPLLAPRLTAPAHVCPISAAGPTHPHLPAQDPQFVGQADQWHRRARQ